MAEPRLLWRARHASVLLNTAQSVFSKGCADGSFLYPGETQPVCLKNLIFKTAKARSQIQKTEARRYDDNFTTIDR